VKDYQYTIILYPDLEEGSYTVTRGRDAGRDN
jgi:hypothetical protein